MSNKIKLGVNGAAGRMGQRIVALAHADSELAVAAALNRPSLPIWDATRAKLPGLARSACPLLPN